MHDTIVKKVLATKIVFFEENTQGRIINRFSKDIQTLDRLVFTFLEMIDYLIKCALSLIVIISVAPALILVALLSGLYLLHIRRICISVTQDPVRLKFALMSPVNSLIQDAINGLPTLRCLNQKDYFLQRLQESSDL